MGPWQNLPEWAQELEEHLQEGESALFILHGQVFDYLRVNGDYLPFRHFLGHWLAQERHAVFYNLGLGLEFWDAPGKTPFGWPWSRLSRIRTKKKMCPGSGPGP